MVQVVTSAASHRFSIRLKQQPYIEFIAVKFNTSSLLLNRAPFGNCKQKVHTYLTQYSLICRLGLYVVLK